MRSRLEIVSKLVEDKHITFEEGLMLMEAVKKQDFKPEPLKTNFSRKDTLPDWIVNQPVSQVSASNAELSIMKMNENFCSK